MSLRFRGGEKIQRGRGIGGLLRSIGSFFKPMARALGTTAMKVARSDAGKIAGNALKEQAVQSAMNLTADAMRGNDLKDSLQKEVGAVKETVADTLDQIVKKRKAPPIKTPRPKKKKSRDLYKRLVTKVDMKKYADDKVNDILME